MGSSGFFIICILHSIVAITFGILLMFYTKEVSVFGYGRDIASRLQGSTPKDELLIQTSESFSGLLVFAIGFVLFMVAFVKDREFHSFFAKGCVLLHLSMAVWRSYFERKIEFLGGEWMKQALGDFALGLSWVFFLVYSWREKYD